MSAHSAALPGAAPYHLMVEAEPETNVLLRLLEPFVIHDILPERMVSATREGEDGMLRLDLHFRAPPDLAHRLEARLATMVTVRRIRLMSTSLAVGTAA